MVAPTSLADARAAAATLGAASPVGTEDVGLERVVGRIAGATVVARTELPTFASSAMDGWAVRAADVANATPGRPIVLAVAGESRAGRPSEEAVAAGAALRISTGARLPAGADAVVRLEDADLVGPGAAGVAVRAPIAPGRDVRLAGEDLATGDPVVADGDRLHPGHVALLAGLGTTSVVCRRRPRALVVVTGDEVAATGRTPRAGGVHDVGGPALAAVLGAMGVEVAEVRHVGDDRAATMAALSGTGADLVVSCGGVSVGPHDHVRGALEALGADEVVGALALQPGRPTWLGGVPGGDGPRPVLALPGNPGAALTVATLLLPHLIGAMTGRPAGPERIARLTAETHGDARRVRALRVALDEDADGRCTATVLEGQQPHRLASFPATAAFALVPAVAGALPAGSAVEVVAVPFAG